MWAQTLHQNVKMNRSESKPGQTSLPRFCVKNQTRPDGGFQAGDGPQSGGAPGRNAVLRLAASLLTP